MPKEQYMCQLCANHGVFNQPKKGHKQKCPHRNCPCNLCGLNTKRRALDQIERQLKAGGGSQTPSSSSALQSPHYPPTTTHTLSSALSSMASSMKDSSPEECGPITTTTSSHSSVSPSTSSSPDVPPYLPTSLSVATNPSLAAFLAAASSPFFSPPFLPHGPPHPAFMMHPLAGLLPPPSSSPSFPSFPSSPFSLAALGQSTVTSASTSSNGQKSGGPIHTPRSHHTSSNPYAIALPATITRKTMREALKTRSLSAALENIRAKSEAGLQNATATLSLRSEASSVETHEPMRSCDETLTVDDESSRSIFHSVEQLAR